MQVVYLNDTRTKQAVFVHTMHNFVRVLGPAESAVLDVFVAEGQAVFVKVWDGRVLVSVIDSWEKS